MSGLKKHQTVMHQDPGNNIPHYVYFETPSDEGDPTGMYFMPREQFYDFGQPEIITVSIVSGDALNVKEEPQVIYRSAKTGKIVTEKYAKSHPDITVREKN